MTITMPNAKTAGVVGLIGVLFGAACYVMKKRKAGEAPAAPNSGEGCKCDPCECDPCKCAGEETEMQPVVPADDGDVLEEEA